MSPKMTKPNKRTQPRCERCILMHRLCDAASPICSTCANHRDGPLDCVYPEDQPSRAQLKARKMEEAAAEKAKKAEQAANRKAAGITYGFGKGLYGTVPDSWPEKYGGKGGYQKMIDEAAKLRGGGGEGNADAEYREEIEETPGEEKLSEVQRGKKRRRTNKKQKTLPTAAANDDESEVEIDIAQGFPPLVNGERFTGPMEVRAPVAPSLGTPFDPHINPDWFNRTPDDVTLEEIGRNLAISLENSLPRHRGGVLNGLSDWSKCDAPAPTTKEGKEEELRLVKAVVDQFYPIIFKKKIKKSDKS